MMLPIVTPIVSEADARLVTGTLRSGKTCFIVSQAKDDYHAKLNGLMMPNNSGQIIKAKALTDKDRDELRQRGVRPHPFNHVRVFSDDFRQSKIVTIPKGYLVLSPVKIFSNFHLYGMRYSLISIVDILEDINGDTISDAWFLSDESSWLDTRYNMTSEGKEMAKFLSSIGKRRLHFLQTVPYKSFVEGRYRLLANTRVLCKYDPITKMITVDVKEGSNPSKSFSFWMPYYCRNYDTNERPHEDEARLARVLKKFVPEAVGSV